MDSFGRPDWDNYFMFLCYVIAMRSLDPRTKCGCVIVDTKHKIKTTGYNGPLPGIDDSLVPTQPPMKYFWMEHSERGALYSYPGDLEGCIAYITGYPCSDCARGLMIKGIKKIIYGPNLAVMSKENQPNMDSVVEMAKAKGVELMEYKGNFWEVYDILTKYLSTKNILHKE